MSMRRNATPSELESLTNKETRRLTNLTRTLLLIVSLILIASLIVGGAIVFATVWVVSHVTIEVESVDQIVSNIVLASNEIAKGSVKAEGAIAAAAMALNSSSFVLNQLSAYLAAPEISLSLGGRHGLAGP